MGSTCSPRNWELKDIIMSHRQLRKILSEKKREKGDGEEEEEEEEEEEVVKKNTFNDLDFEVLEESSEEEQKAEKCESNEQEEKKKRVDKKGSQKKKRKEKECAKEEEDLEDILQNFEEEAIPPPLANEKIDSVLKRRVKNFDPSPESQRIFKEDRKAPHKSHQAHKSGKKLALTPNTSYPPNIDCLLSMEKVSDPTKSIFFFDISKAYSKLHPTYIECIETNDANSLNQFLHRYPFHIEALFQMCMVFQMQGNYEQVASLVERLLYSFQLSFHYQFSVISNNIEIDMDMNVYNKIFYKCLMMHADILGRKGCVRAALEVVKLILALSPQQDPAGALFLIDYYSLRSRKFKYFDLFLRNFMKEVYGYGSVLELPHLVYSLALAKAMQEGGFTGEVQEFSEEIRIEDCLDMKSGQVLGWAVAWNPEFARALLKKLGVSEFKEMETGKIEDIYAVRNEDIWKPFLGALRKEVERGEERKRGEGDFAGILKRYEKLDKAEFSFEVRTVIPQEMEIGRNRSRGNLNVNRHPLILFFLSFLPWNYIE